MDKIYLVQVRYRGSASMSLYNYYSTVPYQKDDLVTVTLGDREKRAIVDTCYEIKQVIRLGE